MKTQLKVLFFLSLFLVVIVLVLLIPQRNNKISNLTANVLDSQTKTKKSILELNKEIETLTLNSDYLTKENSQISSLLQKRKALLIEILKQDPNEIYGLSLSPNTTNKLLNYENIEKPIIDLTGNVEITIIDDFDRPENSTYEYYLTTHNGEKYRIYPFNEEIVEPNTKIEIKNGIKIDNSIFGTVDRLSVNIFATPDIIPYNTSTNIVWQAEEAIYCTGTGGSNSWAGPKNTHGTFITEKLTANTTYTITCHNSSDTVTKSVKIKIIKDILTEDYINNILTSYVPPITKPKPYNLAVFLINPSPSWSIPFSVEQVKKEVFDGQFQKFIKESSYGKRYVTGDVYGWIQSNYENPDCSPFDGTDTNHLNIQDYIIANNIPIESYDYTLLVVHCTNNNGVTYPAGSGVINIKSNGLTEQWIGPAINVPQPFSWTRFDRLLAHEFGHMIGLWHHADGLNCEENNESCQEINYGNAFDSMGEGGYGLHYNALYKNKLGWINDDQILNISKTGRYAINFLEENIGIKMATISNPSSPIGKKMIIETRKAIGFDGILNNPILSNNQNGLFVYYTKPIDGSGGVHNLLIDTTPTPQNWYSDIQSSAVRESPYNNTGYIDKKLGIKLKNVKKTQTSVFFDVEIDPNIPECNQPISTVELHSPFNYSRTNEPLYQYFAKFLNNHQKDYCKESMLEIEITPKDGNLKTYKFYQNDSAGAFMYLHIGLRPPDPSFDFTIEPIPNIPLGQYKYNINIKNITFPNTPETNESITINVVP